jgi:hypothetical protein
MTNEQPIAASVHSPSQSRWFSHFVIAWRRRMVLFQTTLVGAFGSWQIARLFLWRTPGICVS